MNLPLASFSHKIHTQLSTGLGMGSAPNIVVDFLSSKSIHRLRTSNLRDPLLRAVGLKNDPLTVLDATAGFGTDACLLAYYGANVLMLEREPTMGALLQAGLNRAQNEGELMQVAARMSLKMIDAKQYLRDLNPADYPDVIYLDPMFVHRKKSALPNKNMQFLQSCCDDSDADELLTLALTRAHKRVVIKRALTAPLLGGIKPDLCIKSKLLRFDVILISHPS